MLKKLFATLIYECNKLKRLSLASLSNLVLSLWVILGAYIMEAPENWFTEVGSGLTRKD